jgi:hypothetical protein
VSKWRFAAKQIMLQNALQQYSDNTPSKLFLVRNVVNYVLCYDILWFMYMYLYHDFTNNKLRFASRVGGAKTRTRTRTRGLKPGPGLRGIKLVRGLYILCIYYVLWGNMLILYQNKLDKIVEILSYTAIL